MLSAPFAAAMQAEGRWHNLAHGTPPLTRFQVMGERASGTNLIRALIDRNTTLAASNALGWKHGFPTMSAIPADLLVVCALRAPAPWALSMHRRPWHAHPGLQALGFSDFIRAEWRSVVDRPSHFPNTPRALKGALLQWDRDPLTGAAFPNLFALRTAKLTALTGMAAREASVLLVQMERVVEHPEGFLTWLTETTGAPRTGPLSLPSRRMGTRFTRAALAPATPPEMSPEDHIFMHNTLDLPLETALGYGEKSNSETQP